MSNGRRLPRLRKARRKAVLVVEVGSPIGHDPQHRHARSSPPASQGPGEGVHIPPEFVDDRAVDHAALLRLQQSEGAGKGGEHAAPVDVPHQHHRRGQPALAMPMLTMSCSFRLISAGLPAPSRTMMSFSAAKATVRAQDLGAPAACFLVLNYSAAMVAHAPRRLRSPGYRSSLLGLSRMGFIRTSGVAARGLGLASPGPGPSPARPG